MEYKETELSQWFDLNVQKPWQKGVYLAKTGSGHNYWSFWDGKEFGWGCMEKDSANLSRRGGCLAGSFVRWRGLSSAPSPNPKRKGNPRVTRYVVRSADKMKVFASFDDVDNARLYADHIKEPVRITKIRFRTPEAKK